MPAPLILHLTDYQDDAHWRWALHDASDRFLADHEVRLDTASREYRGFVDLADYLDFYSPIRLPAQQLDELGHWIGLHVFGDLREALARACRAPATPVTVTVPDNASGLLLRPLELARLPDGRSFAAVGIRFVYRTPPPSLPRGGGGADHRQATTHQPLPQIGGGREGVSQPLPQYGGGREGVSGEGVRILAVFTLPDTTNPLNLRRERHNLRKLVRQAQSQGKAVDLRVLQYGATRASLRAALEEAPGWDVVQISGHGLQGELVLEDERGGVDRIDADALAALLALGQERLRLLILNACYSGAASHQAARARIGLDTPTRQEEGAGPEAGRGEQPTEQRAEQSNGQNDEQNDGQSDEESEAVQVTVLPSLGQRLAERLGCAALAMRYPVGDAFAADLMTSLYDKLLDKGRPLPGALHLALDEILAPGAVFYPPLSPATPILLGRAAEELRLPLPSRGFRLDALPATGLGIAFPPEPERFVGRLGPMRRASQALAPANPSRGVLLHGMPGAGKTACALELAYRHSEGRFVGFVWFKGPEAGVDISRALYDLLFEMERQLDAPQLALTAGLEDPATFRQRTLPRLANVLAQNALLLVLDNLENLLTSSGHWRDPLWGDLLDALLGQRGASRVILTSRRIPAGLAEHPALHPALQVEAIHALSFAESVLLAQELPHLARLFADGPGQTLLQRTLRIVQGHPKLLELADGLAADRDALAAQLDAAEAAAAAGDARLDAFFAPAEKLPPGAALGESRQSEADFIAALRGWTGGLAARLSPAAGLLLPFLCRLQAADRQTQIVQANWQDFLNRIASPIPAAALDDALAELAALGLIAVETADDGAQSADETPQSTNQPFNQSLLSNLTPETLQSLLASLSTDADPAQLAALQAMLADPDALAALQSQITQSPNPPINQSPNQPITIHPGVAESVLAGADPAHLAAVDRELGDFYIAMYQRAIQNEMQGGTRTVAEAARRAAPYLMAAERWQAASTLLERLLHRDGSPAAVSFALPLLRRIVEASGRIQTEGILANALRAAGRVDEAERTLRALIERCVAQGEFKLASGIAGDLLNLLMAAGRLQEALALAEEKAEYSRRAGLGPWTQLLDETWRLQVLAGLGHYDEVLDAVEELRPRMAALAQAGDEAAAGAETVNPWNVREVTLDTGRTAAMYSQRWQTALEFNDEIYRVTEERGADALEVARTRFNDYSPLLRLGRYDEARALLHACRRVFEAERDLPGLGKVYSALADLADSTGDRAEAVAFEGTALRYRYQVGEPEDCAISHNNLANYTQRQDGPAATVLAHRLAAAIILLQTGSGQLPSVLHNFAVTGLPATPPAFAGVVETVEAIEGVRFGWLFERLPRRAADGDSAIAAVWGLVGEEIQRRDAEEQGRRETADALRSALPPEVMAALESGDEAQVAALLESLSPEQQRALMEQMMGAAQAAGVALPEEPTGPDMAAVLERFEPLLQGIAAVARGDEGPRAEIEALLPQLEESGWQLAAPVARIWARERERASLTANIDGNSAQLVGRVLDILAGDG